MPRSTARPIGVPAVLLALASTLPLLAAGSPQIQAVPRPPQSAGAGPGAVLSPAPRIDLPSLADSNSPAIWAHVDGVLQLRVLTSVAGSPSVSAGDDMARLRLLDPVRMDAMPPGVWMEAVVAAEDGTWYGFYHNELIPDRCEGTTKVAPRIGAARSEDYGASWRDLGPILEAPGFTTRCDTPNHYFTSGVGDFSVALDADGTDLYIFYSQYPVQLAGQGVAVARLPWADRDEPIGRVSVWRDGVWRPARQMSDGAWAYPIGTPIYGASDSWHDDNDTVDAFWGPSVHWNSHLQAYVMLLNRARDVAWTQEGIYIAYAMSLDDPDAWSTPMRLLEGGRWYPQVIGLEAGHGTDKTAGSVARFFMGGTSEHFITFTR